MGPRTVRKLKQMNLIGKSEMNIIITVKIKKKGRPIQVIYEHNIGLYRSSVWARGGNYYKNKSGTLFSKFVYFGGAGKLILKLF